MAKPCLLLVIDYESAVELWTEIFQEHLEDLQVHWEGTVEDATNFLSSTDLEIKAMFVDMLLPENQVLLGRYRRVMQGIEKNLEKARAALNSNLESFYRMKAKVGMEVVDELLDKKGGQKVVRHAAEVLSPVLKSEVLTIPTVIFSQVETTSEEKAKTFRFIQYGYYRWVDFPDPKEICIWIRERLT